MADVTLTELDDQDDELARQASTTNPQAHSAMDDYEIGRELGSGSFATCWSARHKRTGQEVAVKVIEVRPGLAQQQMAEIEHMVKVGRHPCILEVRDARLEGPYIYLVSPLCRGSLADRMEAEPIAKEEWVQWLSQAAEGLSLLHRCQIVHCDVKPANLLLDRNDHLLLADLGQARPTGDPRPRMGSYFYMPPEQAEGNPPQSSWDMYALGASFYCALTGYPPRSRSFPLEGDSHEQRLKVYRSQLPQAPLLPSAQVPAEFWPLLRRMLELDPRRRPSDMQEVVACLRKLQPKIPRSTRQSQRAVLSALTLCLALGLLSQVFRGGLFGELSLWFSLSLGVVARVALISMLAGALSGASLRAWEYQRNR